MEKYIANHQVVQGQFLTFKTDIVEYEQGKSVRRDIVEHPGAVGIIALYHDKIVCVKQYRYALGCDLLEIPAGKINAGELPVDAARRELAEETGLLAVDLEELGKFAPAPGFSNEIIHLYYTDSLTKITGENSYCQDADENITICYLTLEDLHKQIMGGQVIDLKTSYAYNYLQALVS